MPRSWWCSRNWNPNPRITVLCTVNDFFFLSDSFFFEWAEESRPTTAKFGSCHGVDRHHLLAAMAATYALHVTLLVQTRDRTVDSHPPSRFVDSLFLQT